MSFFSFVTSEVSGLVDFGDYYYIKTILISMQFPMEHVPNMWTSLKSEELIINSTKIKPTARGSSISVSDYVFSLKIQAIILTVSYSTFNSYGISFGSHSFPHLFSWFLITYEKIYSFYYCTLPSSLLFPVFWLHLECY